MFVCFILLLLFLVNVMNYAKNKFTYATQKPLHEKKTEMAKQQNSKKNYRKTFHVNTRKWTAGCWSEQPAKQPFFTTLRKDGKRRRRQRSRHAQSQHNVRQIEPFERQIDFKFFHFSYLIFIISFAFFLSQFSVFT